MKSLDGKVAIITGAAQGMGEAHARLFVAEGAKVVLTDLNVQKGAALAKELGDSAIFVEQDVVSSAQWQTVAEKAVEAFGKVNILVNNAGITSYQGVLDMSEQEYRRIIDINQVSVFLGMKAIIPLIIKAGGGSVVNISSINGLVAGRIAYTDSKFAVRGMSKAAALEFAGSGVRVNSVHPGVIATPMVEADPRILEATKPLVKTIPLRRMAEPIEVSNLVLFLASDAASYITGSEFAVDGGLTSI